MPKIITDPVTSIQIAAKQIMTEEGYEGLNMRHVAKKSGIAIGTLYNYFESKEALVIHLMSNYWDTYFEVIDAVDAKPMSFYEKLSLIYQHFKIFTDDFHEIFLSQSFRPNYTDKTKANKVNFMLKLQQRFGQMVTQKPDKPASLLSDDEIAEFILANFVSITYMPSYSYVKFEKALKAILG